MSGRLVHASGWVAPPVLPPHLSFTPSPPLHAAAFEAQRTEYTQKGESTLFPSPPPRPLCLHTLELCERHTLLMPLPGYIHLHTLIKTRCACFLCSRKEEVCPPLACFLTPPSLRSRYHSPHSLSPFRALLHPLTAPNTQAQGFCRAAEYWWGEKTRQQQASSSRMQKHT